MLLRTRQDPAAVVGGFVIQRWCPDMRLSWCIAEPMKRSPTCVALVPFEGPEPDQVPR